MNKGTYLSGDELDRAEAFQLGYGSVCQYPSELGVLEVTDTLVIDFDHVLFHDKDLAVLKANEAARRGVWVGIHTYYPDDPRLQRFLNLPNVVVGKTHKDVLKALEKQAHLKSPQPKKIAQQSVSE